jgi:hypothetical protein
VTVIALEWLREPEVPVTITVALAADVDGLFEVFDILPLHPKANSETSNTRPSKLIPTMFFCLNDFRLQVVNRVPNKPRPGKSNPMRGAL